MDTTATSMESSQLANICRQFSMSNKANEILKNNSKSETFIDSLVLGECYADAILFLSHSLPYRKGIQWAFTCVRAYAENGVGTQSTNDSLRLVENWLKHPTESNRQNILPKQVVQTVNAEGWLAMAAYWAGGSISENDQQIIPAPIGLVNNAIYSAVMLSVFDMPEFQRRDIFENIIKWGNILLEEQSELISHTLN